MTLSTRRSKRRRCILRSYEHPAHKIRIRAALQEGKHHSRVSGSDGRLRNTTGRLLQDPPRRSGLPLRIHRRGRADQPFFLPRRRPTQSFSRLRDANDHPAQRRRNGNRGHPGRPFKINRSGNGAVSTGRNAGYAALLRRGCGLCRARVYSQHRTDRRKTNGQPPRSPHSLLFDHGFGAHF